MSRFASTAAAGNQAAMQPSTLKSTWECVRSMSRAFATAALAAAIALALAATASAQTVWSLGSEYNAATLGSGEYLTTNSTYSTTSGSAEWTVEAWVNLPSAASGIISLENASEGLYLYTTWDGSNHTLHVRTQGQAPGAGGITDYAITTASMAPGQWYHVSGGFSNAGTPSIFGSVNDVFASGAIASGSVPVLDTWSSNEWGRTPNFGGSGDLSLDGSTTGFRVWRGIHASDETNSAVNKTPLTGSGTNFANFQVGTNGNTTALVASPQGGTLNATTAANATVAKYGAGTIGVTTDSYFLDTIEDGILQLGGTTVGGGTVGALTSDVVNNGTLSFNRSNDLTHAQVISGTGIVSQDGTGTTTLSGNNSYSGATNVNAGTLRVTHVNGLGTTAGGTSVASGATLELASGAPAVQFAEGITLNGGTLTTVTGGTTIVSGTVNLVSDSFISTALAGTDALDITGVISGAGGFTFSGDAANLTASNTYGGNTIINRGALFVTADGALGSTAGSTTVNATTTPAGGLVFSGVNYSTAEPVSLNGGYIASTGISTFAGPISVDAASAIAEGSHNGSLTLSGVISGSQALQVGATGYTGTVKLTGSNTYTGALSVAAGTLRIGDGGTAGSIAPSGLTNNGLVIYDRNDAVSVGYAISGSGAVTQAGSGVLTLSGTNTYNGDTNVTAGTLNIAGTLASDVIVGAGGTLAGSGSSTGEVSGAGIVGPGNSPGILTFATLNASAGMTFNFEFTGADPDYTNASSSVNDVLRLTEATTPFTAPLASSSTVNIYVNSLGTNFSARGGFFTDKQADFITSIQDATFNFYLADVNGSTSYNGANYTNVNSYNWSVTTVPVTGAVTGQVMQVVPEPSSFALMGMGIAGLAAAGYRRRKAAMAKTVA